MDNNYASTAFSGLFLIYQIPFLNQSTFKSVGGNSGIGLEACKVLAYCGCKVYLCSRSISNGEAAIEKEIKQEGEGKYVVQDTSNIFVKQLDLNSLASVKALADDLNNSLDRIDYLILNAGIMALPALERTADGLEKQIGVNHFGHFYLTQLLLPKMKKQTFPSRIVSLSSTAKDMSNLHAKDLQYKERTYKSWEAYGNSKLANFLYARTLAAQLKDTPIRVASVHPGVIKTNLWAASSSTWISWLLSSFFTDKNIPQVNRFSPQKFLSK